MKILEIRSKSKEEAIDKVIKELNVTLEDLEIEVLEPTDIEEMINSEFDLTLYTCTSDSMRRIAVRCNRIYE